MSNGVENEQPTRNNDNLTRISDGPGLNSVTIQPLLLRATTPTTGGTLFSSDPSPQRGYRLKGCGPVPSQFPLRIFCCPNKKVL
ncbi:hypothetical protein RRG08_023616 [Elysia crispata]|uniref:Uncharacterized protein n=1 Tax=Elysia crispata TaxID=231223 RepID=A0AAE0XSI5_9GAST|nr:hypothetical protein RRG08_023616 [Elysia crispata]